MHFTSVLVASLAPISVLSAPLADPVPIPAADMDPGAATNNNNNNINAAVAARQSTQWTMRNAQRPCAQGNTACAWNFDIDTGGAFPTQHCSFRTPGPSASFGGVRCGDFRIGVGYNSEGRFTVLSVVRAGLVIYPGYTDQQLRGGHVVTPDQAYTPRPVPS
ncbi:hypothetical protein PG985_011874 [Apiospora marii]|uniref:Small secreted protein n=1 Tax=Apiospora marii TaxID=335849 RepID=A0ABR1RF17_9PEZI